MLAARSCASRGWLAHGPAVAAAPRGARQVVRYRCSKNSLTAEDKLHIAELCHRFDHAINQGQLEKAGACFVEAGSVQTAKGTVRGRQQLVDYFKTTRPLAEGNRHLTCNIVVEPDGEQGAVATAYRILHKACNPPVLLASGLIEDKLVQEDGVWKFVARKFIMDPPAQQAAAPGAAKAS